MPIPLHQSARDSAGVYDLDADVAEESALLSESFAGSGFR